MILSIHAIPVLYILVVPCISHSIMHEMRDGLSLKRHTRELSTAFESNPIMTKRSIRALTETVPEVCEEDDSDEFAWGYIIKNGEITSAESETCGWLKAFEDGKPDKVTKICRDSIGFDTLKPASEVCVVTCGVCNTTAPIIAPSYNPSAVPTLAPTDVPSVSPSLGPSPTPSDTPTNQPTISPSDAPTMCFEDDNDLFALDLLKDDDGSPIGVLEESCGWLKVRRQQSKINEICDNPITFGDVRAASEVCLVTCNICQTREPSGSEPTDRPSMNPTVTGTTDSPSMNPTVTGSEVPSLIPSPFVTSSTPSTSPSDLPSTYPSETFSESPTVVPTETRSEVPSLIPSPIVSSTPSITPSDSPSISPSKSPFVISSIPSESPSSYPSETFLPTVQSSLPSNTPSESPSSYPSETFLPTDQSSLPSNTPSMFSTSFQPTDTRSSLLPSDEPSRTIFPQPSYKPTQDTYIPTQEMSGEPSSIPSSSSPTSTPGPTLIDSNSPSDAPSDLPSTFPIGGTLEPTFADSDGPSDAPSDLPSILPTEGTSEPTFAYSDGPSESPSDLPSTLPTESTLEPTETDISDVPSQSPSDVPTLAPSDTPSEVPSLIPSSYECNDAQGVFNMGKDRWVTCEEASTPFRCKYNDVVNTRCPRSCNMCPSQEPSEKPSMAPSISSAPTKPVSAFPSLMPSLYECNDIQGMFDMANERWVTCEEASTPYRCKSNDVVIRKCPRSCNLCPSQEPSEEPTMYITIEPSSTPSLHPTINPTIRSPSNSPSNNPSHTPTNAPSTLSPTIGPTNKSTIRPSNSPTLTSSMDPTTNPTAGPTTIPTKVPSASPTRPQVKTIIQIKISPVFNEELDEATVGNIEDDTTKWLQAFFDFTTPKIENVEAKILSQTITPNTSRRLLERSLVGESNFWNIVLNMSVQGHFEMSINEDRRDTDFETLVMDYFKADQRSFLNIVKSYSYFADADEVVIGEVPRDVNSSINEEGTAEKKDNTMIIAIASAVSGVALIVFVVAAFTFLRGRRQGEPSAPALFDVDEVDDEENVFNTSPSIDQNDKPLWKDTLPTKPVYRVSSRDSSKNDNGDDATEGGQTYNTLEKLYSHDSMSFQSYGYSLDSGVPSRSSLKSSDNESLNGEPLQIDLYGLRESSSYIPGEQNRLEVSMMSPASNYSALTNEFGTTSKVGEEDLKNQSMNTNVAVGSRTPKQVRRMSSDLKDVPKYKRVCMAPPGRLGVVIDTTRRGTVVHEVKSGSPLENVVFEGDHIIKIDEFDTNGMSASAVTKIMASKMDKERKITVLSSRDIS